MMCKVIGRSIAWFFGVIIVTQSMAEIQDEKNFKSFEVKYTSSVAYQHRGHVIEFPWDIRLPIDGHGEFIVPETCDELESMLPKIYPLDFQYHINQATLKYTNSGARALVVRSSDDLDPYVDHLYDYFEEAMGDDLLAMYLLASVMQISELWDLQNRLQDKNIQNSFFCVNRYHFELNSDYYIFFAIVVNAFGDVK